jgi:hypothetical protein
MGWQGTCLIDVFAQYKGERNRRLKGKVSCFTLHYYYQSSLSLFQKNKGGGGGNWKTAADQVYWVIILSSLKVAEEAVLAVNLPVEDLAAEAVDSVEDLAVEPGGGSSGSW